MTRSPRPKHPARTPNTDLPNASDIIDELTGARSVAGGHSQERDVPGGISTCLSVATSAVSQSLNARIAGKRLVS